jgi:hypothetical protein
MRKLLYLTFSLLCILLVPLTIGMAARSSNFVLADHWSILHLDMCAAPCWIGIIPGVTSLAEAKQRIRSVYQGEVEPVADNSFYLGKSISFSVLLVGDGPDKPVREIELEAWGPGPELTLKDIINFWSEPTYLCCANHRIPLYYYELVYQRDANHQVVVWTTVIGGLKDVEAGDWTEIPGRIKPSDRVDKLIFRYLADGQADKERADVYHSWMTAWHGFINFGSLLCPDIEYTYDWVQCPAQREGD